MASSLVAATFALASWISQSSPTHVSLRGLAVVSPSVVWASGTKGSWLRTNDGGAHWQTGIVAGAEDLDFRDVAAWSHNDALLLASGEGEKSRIYKTSDGGGHWSLLFVNPDPKGFFDAVSFWDRKRGILLGDPVDGHFAVFTTLDGGRTWQRRTTPAALPGEGAFAASGTCLTIRGVRDAWFGTGGAGHARIFHSEDGGQTWTSVDAGIGARTASSGVFSIAFLDGKRGVAVGGDYQLPNEAADTLALTEDAGMTWQKPREPGLSGFRSAVAVIGRKRQRLIAVGTGGSDISEDSGRTWRRIQTAGLNAVAAARDGSVWAVGGNGLIVKLSER